MKKIVYSILLISSIAFSQTEKSVGDFNKVTSFDQIDVILIQGNENKVVLNGSGSNEVELVNKNGELKIRMPLTKLLSGDNISATVYFKKIDAVEANEGSRIACESVIKSTTFDIKAKEGAQVKLKIETDRLTARVANGSTISISGKADNQDILVNSGGIYEAEKLTTKQTVITNNAGGEADVYATDLVEAKVRAGGDITIYGKPKQINQKIIAGGRIEEAK
ncbi:head GIN domain-containing protein [Flavobacterium sp. SUN052]|uniref:head GIN domain-containing protein n=1 Tax=Flavobacterium sp. SUN052 TaxID=3002441 RepID=UPI00237DA463|nr:head GIN domain-containing protein [Flavobacterium sp. SUN052]MEC4003541.1 head GIN domain-containing protein [Flavobacterium sp. SUN052]